MAASTQSIGSVRAYNNRKWQHTPTKALRVPEIFAEQLKEIARQLDSGNPALIPQQESFSGMSLERLLEIQASLSEAIEIAKEAACDRRLEEAITFLAARCDGAASEDSKGFNAFDAKFGKWLAAEIHSGTPLRKRQAQSALKMVSKYANTQLALADMSLPKWETIEHQYGDEPPVPASEEIATRLELHGNKIYSYSPCSSEGLAKVKAVEPKGSWHSEDKSWRFSTEAARPLLEAFGDYEYIDPAIQAIALEQEREEAIAAQAKLEAAHQAGKALTELIANANLDEPLPCGWTLFQHQKEAVEWLLAHQRGTLYRGGILADHMGLGKTVSALIAARVLSVANNNLPVLVVAPASLRDNWIREAQKVGVAIEIFSWAKVPKPLNTQRYIVIADEAHYAQNLASARTKKLLSLAEHENCLATWLLTGTPLKNGRPSNLFPLLQAIAHPLAADKRHYEEYYCNGYFKEIGRKSVWDVTGSAHLDELSKNLSDALLRRTKDECLDLPEKQRVRRAADLTTTQMRIYKADLAILAQEYRDRIAGAKAKAEAEEDDEEARKLWVEARNLENAQALVTLGMMRKVGSLHKVDSACALAEELLEQGQQVVIFTEFLESAKLLYSSLEGCAELLTGETKQDDRQKIVDRFQAGESKVFIGTISAGGVGLTLTAASHVILVDRPWTPGDAEQAEDRCHRIGQSLAVFAYWLQLGVIDDLMDNLISEKQERIDLVLKGKQKSLSDLDSPSVIAKYLMSVL